MSLLGASDCGGALWALMIPFLSNHFANGTEPRISEGTAAMVTAVGLLLFYVEMCRPGWILPGAAGAGTVLNWKREEKAPVFPARSVARTRQ